MSEILLQINLISLVYLSIFAFLFVFLSVLFLFSKKKSKNKAKDSDQDISILVPSLNEGSLIIDLLKSLSHQDCHNYLNIFILVKDLEDTSIDHLEKFYNLEIKEALKQQNKLNIFKNNRLSVYLVACGFDSKQKKLNHIIPDISSDFIAILDADHRPSVNWLSSSLTCFSSEKISFVQSRRGPLDLSSLPQIWDSVQNHIGNEMLNRSLDFLKANIFFTGTAAVFKAEVLKKNLFSDSITEDTELSYRLLLDKHKSLYNEEAVSYEEVAPTLKSFVMRRRRWSAGHNGVFLKNLLKVFKGQASLAQKLITFFHGQFYFIPLVVLILILTRGIHYFDQIAFNHKIVVILLSIFFAILLSFIFKSGKRISFREFLASFIWIFPQLSILSIAVYYFASWESYYYILSFPLEKRYLLWNIVLYFSPLLAVLFSIIKRREFRSWSSLWFLITYPISLFFDIYAGILGFFDFLVGKSTWSKIKRNNKYSANLINKELSLDWQAKKGKQKNGRTWFLLLISFIALAILTNDLLAINNCGQIEKFLWKPLIIKPQSELNLNIEIIKKVNDSNPENLIIRGRADLSGVFDGFYLISHLNGEKYGQEEIKNGSLDFFEYEVPLGFDSYNLVVNIYSSGLKAQNVCHRQIKISNTLKEIINGEFYLNKEKFLIKGMIPSFLGNNIDLDMKSGFKQIKEIGINALRFYHGATDKIIQEAANNDLLIIDQPDSSTWNNFNIQNDYQVKNFLNRYERAVKRQEGNPYALLTGIGNEWELSNPAPQLASSVYKIIQEANLRVKNFPNSYSTYLTFINYPVDILAINMLDSGDTYWTKVLENLKDSGQMFYASEIGGFVAFREKNYPELRYNRLSYEWNKLLAAGGIGANFYQSHDNWAQPLPASGGYNDPNKAEHYDDLRGFWDHKNKEKIELKALKEILSDLKIIDNFIERNFGECGDGLNISLQNIREYKLKGVILKDDNNEISLGDFLPNEIKEVFIPYQFLLKWDGEKELKFSYTTHSGLKNYSNIFFTNPCLSDKVKILNNDKMIKEEGGSFVKGDLINSNYLNFVVPLSWKKFSLNGQDYENNQTYYSLPVPGPYYDVIDFEYSKDAYVWQEYESGVDIGGGLYYFRFTWPDVLGSDSYLIIDGSGTDLINFDLKFGKKEVLAHSYRENIIHISEINNPKPGDIIKFSLNRNMTHYVDRKVVASNFQVPSLFKNDVIVDLARPVIFSLTSFEIKRLD